MPTEHAESGPGSKSGEEGLGTGSLFCGLRQAHLILHGWVRRIQLEVLQCLEKKNPTRKYLISRQRNQSAVWTQGMSHV